jgi:hypothetical protein
MQQLARRSVVAGLTACVASVALPRDVAATMVRGLSLAELVRRCDLITLLTPLDATSRYHDFAGRRSIVTDIRVRVDDVVAKASPPQRELMVRTLGGRVGSVGEVVHGQPELALDALALGFLKHGSDGNHWVMGMAQGHYPIVDPGSPRAWLAASSNLPTIRDWHASAVRQLRGLELSVARKLVEATAAR